jgi:TolB protein
VADGAQDQVYIGRADGSDLRQIAPCRPPKCASHWEPAWSPDGSRLAISTAAGPMTDAGPARFGISVVDVRSQKVRPVVDHPSSTGQDHFARWSPDGRHMVFWRERVSVAGAAETAVFVVDADGGDARQITPWDLLAGDPDWSPDGSLIVFSTYPLLVFGETGDSDLHVIKPDGSGMRSLTSHSKHASRATQPRWTPDGKAILYVRTGPGGTPRHIWAVNADGRLDAPVLTTDAIYTHPVLQPSP